MAIFKNVVTGNTLTVINKETIELMRGSKRYVEVLGTPAPAGKRTTAKA